MRFLVLSCCEPIFRTANSKGLENCLASPTSLTISVTPGSSVVYRLPKSLSRSVQHGEHLFLGNRSS
jgi:hypothetical protein